LPDHLEPGFSANRAILRLLDLGLQVIDTIFGGVKLTRRLSQPGDDGATGMVGDVVVDGPYSLRRKLENTARDIAIRFGAITRTISWTITWPVIWWSRHPRSLARSGATRSRSRK
jgi:hypothetical protein